MQYGHVTCISFSSAIRPARCEAARMNRLPKLDQMAGTVTTHISLASSSWAIIDYHSMHKAKATNRKQAKHHV